MEHFGLEFILGNTIHYAKFEPSHTEKSETKYGREKCKRWRNGRDVFLGMSNSWCEFIGMCNQIKLKTTSNNVYIQAGAI